VVLLVALLEPFLMATISTSVAVLILGIAMPLYTFLQSAL
jgi:type II secretory pathway component PulF